jgi:STE24 endopeptidase
MFDLNTIGIIIVLIIVTELVLGCIADALNVKNLKEKLPEEFSDVYDQSKYEKSQKYTKVRTRFGIISSVWSVVVLLAFWFFGGFEWLDQIVRNLGYGEIISGLVFFVIIIIAQSILSLPFSLYSTFVIEERFGFNKTTPIIFVTDLLKSMLLGAVLGLPLLAGIMWVFITFGTIAWLYGWIGVTLFTFVIQYVAPTWIMPLFNKFETIEDGSLKDAILSYSEKVKFPLKQVFVMDGSKRSSRANAFFTGFGKNKRIALFDTLIKNHSEDELVAIVAHEVGHYKLKHIIKSQIIQIGYTGLMFFILGIVLSYQPLYEAFFVSEPSVYLGLIFFGLLYTPVGFLLSLGMNIISRKHEFEADAFAADTTGKAQEMISALKKLSADNLSNLTPHPFYVFMNYSHPPVLQRIKALKL